jgi:3-hydroxyacyl-CoA dehydrogenase/enoyl-CoA hydratase/3-hydroxybutyryl-CoA epimerase
MSHATPTRTVHADDPSRLIGVELRDRVLLATIDMPGRMMNVFSFGLMDALEGLIDRIESDTAVHAAVITSGKSSFLAGADLDMVSGFAAMADSAPRAELHETAGRLGRLFVRLEALPKPVVAAINGLALGGGLELALACCHRVAIDDPRAQLGLPEIKLGLLPGAGGTQRLPRLVGVETGLGLLLSGRSLAPREAQKAGLVDEVVERDQLVPRALHTAAQLADQGRWRKLPQNLDVAPFEVSDSQIMRRVSEHFGYSQETVARYPAYRAIIRCVIEGAHRPIAEGGDNEMARFVDLMYDPARTAAAMVRTLFLDRQLADKTTAEVDSRRIRFDVAARGAAAELVSRLLAAVKPPDASAGIEDVTISSPDRQEGPHPRLVLLATADDTLLPGSVGVLVRRSEQHGIAAEIISCETDDAGRRAALALAKQLRATPFVRSGSRSLLANLETFGAQARDAGLDEAGVLLAQALVASRFQGAGEIGDTRFADVASVVSGIYPAYTGGPFNYLRLLGSEQVAQQRNKYSRLAPRLFVE